MIAEYIDRQDQIERGMCVLEALCHLINALKIRSAYQFLRRHSMYKYASIHTKDKHELMDFLAKTKR